MTSIEWNSLEPGTIIEVTNSNQLIWKMGTRFTIVSRLSNEMYKPGDLDISEGIEDPRYCFQAQMIQEDRLVRLDAYTWYAVVSSRTVLRKSRFENIDID